MAVAVRCSTFVLVPTIAAGNTDRVHRLNHRRGAHIDRVSAAEATTVVVAVANTGKQTLNHDTTSIGVDDDPAVEANPQTSLTPTVPVAFAGQHVGHGAGCTAAPARRSGVASARSRRATLDDDGRPDLHERGKREGVRDQGRTFAKEGGSDNGANKDTFAAEGSITFLPFSVRLGHGVPSDRLAHRDHAVRRRRQREAQSSVVLPDGLTHSRCRRCPMGRPARAPPTWSASRPGDAQIVGDSIGDVVRWTVTYNVKNIKVRLDKLRVVHYTDAGVVDPVGGFSLKDNAARRAARSTVAPRCCRPTARRSRSSSRPPATARPASSDSRHGSRGRRRTGRGPTCGPWAAG